VQDTDTNFAAYDSTVTPGPGVANANGAISVAVVAIPGGVAAQGLGVYEGNNPWPIDAGLTPLITLDPQDASYDKDNVAAAKANLTTALAFLDSNGARGAYGGLPVIV
jgi:hypothetical protein